MSLRADEKELVGQWLFDGQVVQPDAVTQRIEHLTKHVLQKTATSRAYGAWETLFRDPMDGRLWERTYPQGELHGGGPPRLAVISESDAQTKYDFA